MAVEPEEGGCSTQPGQALPSEPIHSLGGAPSLSAEDELGPDIAREVTSLTARFERLFMQCQREGKRKISFLESKQYSEDLQSAMHGPNGARQLSEKEQILVYYEKEFELKEELTSMLFERKKHSIEKYKFQTEAEIAEAVDTFLSREWEKTLAGIPTAQGLRDINVELYYLKNLRRVSPLYQALQLYFNAAE